MRSILALLVFLSSSQFAFGSAYQDTISIEGRRIEITRAAHDDIIEASLIKILYQAASTPVFDLDGDQVGYMLTEIEPDSVYLTAGLRDGDIVTEVDGIRLMDPKIAVEVLRYVKTEPRFTYKVLRGTEILEFMVVVSND